MSNIFYLPLFYHLRTMSNMILPPTKMSNILSKYVYFPLYSLKEKKTSSRFAVRTFLRTQQPKLKFAVRSSHLPTHPKAKTKVRGSQFAVRSSHLLSLLFPFLKVRSSLFAVRSSHLVSLCSSLSEKFAVRIYSHSPLP